MGRERNHRDCIVLEASIWTEKCYKFEEARYFLSFCNLFLPAEKGEFDIFFAVGDAGINFENRYNAENSFKS